MKYLLSVVARYDGISRLKDNRWGFFPGISAGWNVTEEEFWKESKISDIISNIKPRISYGVNGNVNGIGNFDIYGIYMPCVGNRAVHSKPDLTWDSSTTG